MSSPVKSPSLPRIRNPLLRQEFPWLVSEVVLFLASDASALLTGAQVAADTGSLKI
jgi:hypothetical protein